MYAQCVVPNQIANNCRIAHFMNKADVIDIITSDLDIQPLETKSGMDTILDAMTAALNRGESVKIRGLGCITSKNYDTYLLRN